MKKPLFIFIIGLLIGILNFRVQSKPSPKIEHSEWPTHFEDLALTQLPLSDREEAFAASFPGAIAIFQTAQNQQIILRRTERATRKLHDSATCLRSSGFTINNRKIEDGWITYTARNNLEILNVRERIQSTSDDANWTEVSAWFWHALLHSDQGPWLAITVIEKI